MPSTEEHCKESMRIFGKPYLEVHMWLDALIEEYGPYHRKKRHHLAGLKQVERIFGKEAVGPAMLHIKSDLQQQGWKDTDPIPEDEKDFIKRLTENKGGDK